MQLPSKCFPDKCFPDSKITGICFPGKYFTNNCFRRVLTGIVSSMKTGQSTLRCDPAYMAAHSVSNPEMDLSKLAAYLPAYISLQQN